METNLTENEKMVINFLRTLEQRQSSEELVKFYHKDVEQVEYPNAVVKNTVVRSLKDLSEGSEKGKKILSKEEYEVQHIYSSRDSVVIEAIWRGTLSVQIGTIPAGGRGTA